MGSVHGFAALHYAYERSTLNVQRLTINLPTINRFMVTAPRQHTDWN
jgi:hypothetical protein